MKNVSERLNFLFHSLIVFPAGFRSAGFFNVKTLHNRKHFAIIRSSKTNDK